MEKDILLRQENSIYKCVNKLLEPVVFFTKLFSTVLLGGLGLWADNIPKIRVGLTASTLYTVQRALCGLGGAS